MPYITSKFKAHKNVTNKFNALPWFRLSKMPTLSYNRSMSLFNFLSSPLIALSVNVSWPMYWWITNDGFSLESLSCPQEIFSDAFWNIFSPLVWIVNKPESIPKRNKIFIVVKTIQDYFKLCNGWSPHVYRLKGWRLIRLCYERVCLENCQMNLSLGGATDQAPTKLNNDENSFWHKTVFRFLSRTLLLAAA